MVFGGSLWSLDRILVAFNMNKQKENLAFGISVFILVIAAWYWSNQIADVIETLTLAYG